VARLDYDEAAEAYARGRPLPRVAITAWCDAVAPYLGADRQRPILDVGAGSGWFAAAFAERFDRGVVAVEPSAGMRIEAAGARSDARVRYVAGVAECLPLRPQSGGAAWLSTVIHHYADLDGAARELARVLVPGAPVLVRSVFPGRLDGITLFRFFPSARRTANSFPSLERTLAAFGAAGFAHEALAIVSQLSLPTLGDAAQKVRTMRHADTTLRTVSDDEFAAGLRAIDDAAAAAPTAPVVDHFDLLVLRLPAR
jgi:ubiquinone/menaquinone biosynthesis C-methylase UbiE